MVRLAALAAALIVCSCGQPTIENGCHAELVPYWEELECTRDHIAKLEQELAVMKVRMEYECSEGGERAGTVLH